MIDAKTISLVLLTKEDVYPKEILDHVLKFPWGEILILTHSDSCFNKYELFAKAKYETIYYNDDDAICPIADLLALSQPNIINVAMKQGHFNAYKDSKATMGIGWGSIFPKSLLKVLDKYVKVYGEDDVYKRDTDRIFTYLNYPQNRMILPITDLPSAYAPDRMWRQPNHVSSAHLAEERCHNLPQNETNT